MIRSLACFARDRRTLALVRPCNLNHASTARSEESIIGRLMIARRNVEAISECA